MFLFSLPVSHQRICFLLTIEKWKKIRGMPSSLICNLCVDIRTRPNYCNSYVMIKILSIQKLFDTNTSELTPKSLSITAPDRLTELDKN